jgi:hypothetical protein
MRRRDFIAGIAASSSLSRSFSALGVTHDLNAMHQRLALAG